LSERSEASLLPPICEEIFSKFLPGLDFFGSGACPALDAGYQDKKSDETEFHKNVCLFLLIGSNIFE